jgi:hypothetical protein
MHLGPQHIAFPTHRVSFASILTPTSLFRSKLDMHEKNTQETLQGELHERNAPSCGNLSSAAKG